MQRLKLMGLALMAVFALSAVVSASSLGAVEILNKNGHKAENITFSGTSKKTTTFTILEGFGETKCSEVVTEGTQTGSTLLGLFHLHWTGCTTNVGGTCTGLGDLVAGTILALGTYHLVEDKLLSEGSLGMGILFLLEHVHYTCEGGLIIGKPLILVLGEVLCLVTPLTLTTVFTIKCEKGAHNGDPKETKYWTEGGTEVNMGENALLASEDEGTTYKMSAQSGEGETTINEQVEIMD